MAGSHGSKAKLYAGALELTSFLTSVDAAATADTAEKSTLGMTSKAYVAGLKDATLSGDGLFFGDTDELDEYLDANLVGDPILTYWPAGDALGAAGKALQAIFTSYEIATPVGDVAS